MKALYFALTLIAVPAVSLVLGRPVLPALALAWGGASFGAVLLLGTDDGIDWSILRSSTRAEWSAMLNAKPERRGVVRWSAFLWFWGCTLVALWGVA